VTITDKQSGSSGKVTHKVCPECDLIHEKVDLKSGRAAHCNRCGKLLYRSQPRGLEFALSFAICGLAFFVVANLTPLLIFSMGGNSSANLLVDGGIAFLQTMYWPLGLLVIVASVVAPFAILCLVVLLLLPLRFGYVLPASKFLYRLIMHIRPWAMAEIFVIGLIVAYVKLADFASVSVGLSMISFVCMVVASVIAISSLDADDLWARIDEVSNNGRA
jgi:paraquat-inducible protein A